MHIFMAAVRPVAYVVCATKNVSCTFKTNETFIFLFQFLFLIGARSFYSFRNV